MDSSDTTLQLPRRRHRTTDNGHRKTHRPAECHALPAASGRGRGRASARKHYAFCLLSRPAGGRPRRDILVAARRPVHMHHTHGVEGYVKRRTRFFFYVHWLRSRRTLAVDEFSPRVSVRPSSAVSGDSGRPIFEPSGRPGRRRSNDPPKPTFRTVTRRESPLSTTGHVFRPFCRQFKSAGLPHIAVRQLNGLDVGSIVDDAFYCCITAFASYENVDRQKVQKLHERRPSVSFKQNESDPLVCF